MSKTKAYTLFRVSRSGKKTFVNYWLSEENFIKALETKYKGKYYDFVVESLTVAKARSTKAHNAKAVRA